MVYIAIDLDGTAWKYQKEFKQIIKGLKGLGFKVGILTAHQNLKDADLRLWKARGFPSIDFYISKTEEPNINKLKDIDWKREVMKKNNIDLLFDDKDTGKVILILKKLP